MSGSTTKFLFYHFTPSLAAAAIFVLLFLATALLHVFQLFKNKTWYFLPLVIGGFFEHIGYVGRAISSKQSPDWTVGPYVAQSLLTLLAPTLFAASIYMILGRIIRLKDGDSIHLFGPGGGGMLSTAKTTSAEKKGQYAITGGLLIQVLFFGFFILVSAIFHIRISKLPTVRSITVQVPWQGYLIILYVVSTFIMIRSIFRIAEYVQGQNGSLLRTETYLYVFDATQMLLTMVLFNIFHPSKIISKEVLKGTWNEGEGGVAYEYEGVVQLGNR